RSYGDWSSDVCSSDLDQAVQRSDGAVVGRHRRHLQLRAQLAHPVDQAADAVELGFIVGIGARLPRGQLPLRLVELDLASPHDVRSEERRVGKEWKRGG